MTTAFEGLRVLVVEDEFLVATLIEDMLESAGCIVSGPDSARHGGAQCDERRGV